MPILLRAAALATIFAYAMTSWSTGDEAYTRVGVDLRRPTAQAAPTEPWRHAYFMVTAYVVNPREHGKCATYSRPTASQTHAQYGTIAVDTDVLPFGTELVVPGYGYGRARDRGGAIVRHRLDLAMESCTHALAWGRRRVLIAYRFGRWLADSRARQRIR